MFLNPKKAISEGWLRGVSEANIQPNAVDIPVNKIYEMRSHSAFYLRSDGKTHRNRVDRELTSEGLWKLTPGAYDFFSEAYVEVPEGVCGWLITRSTLNRNGIIVHSGLYDSGYKGHLSGTLYVFHGANFIEPGVCICQFIMASSKSEGVYAGGYNAAEGELPEQLKEHIK